MNLCCVILGALFIAAGIAFFAGLGSKCIKGLNELTTEEKKIFNVQKLDRLLGRIFLSAGLIFEAGGFNEAFLRSAFNWFMLAWFILVGLTVFLLSKYRWFYHWFCIYRNDRKRR